jgi:hypothetical protein
LGFSACGAAAAAAPAEIALETLAQACQAAIAANKPDAAEELVGPEIFKDAAGDLSVGWNSLSNTFFKAKAREAKAAKAIGAACPEVAIVSYAGPTGGTERWFIRRDGFSVRHARDSGMPGDKSKYSGWETVPFDYDPSKSYD